MTDVNTAAIVPIVFSAIYILCLLGVVAIGLYVYGDINQIQDGLLPSQFWTASNAYRHFISLTGRVLSIMLGLTAATIGLASENTIRGLLSLVGGALITMMAWSLLPHVYFPGIDFSPWLLWLADNIYWLLGTWMVITSFYTLREKIADG